MTDGDMKYVEKNLPTPVEIWHYILEIYPAGDVWVVKNGAYMQGMLM